MYRLHNKKKGCLNQKNYISFYNSFFLLRLHKIITMKHSNKNLRTSFVVFSISLTVVLLALYSCHKTEYTRMYNSTPLSTELNPQLPPQAYTYPKGDNDLATLGR